MGLDKFDWKHYLTRIQKQSYFFLGVAVIFLFVAVGGGVWYYVQQQESEKEAARLQAEREHNNNVASINKYYKEILTGSSINNFMTTLYEVDKSKIPLSLSGFALDKYGCDINKCTFSYSALGGGVFNVQELYFNGESYKANISENGLEYGVEPSPLSQDLLMDQFNSRQEIPVAECSELINYVYSFNSTVVDVKKKLKLLGYPQSSISKIENILPEIKEKYGFLNVKWSVVLPDNTLEISSFLNRQAYKSSFLINKIEKNNSLEVEISGALLCAN